MPYYDYVCTECSLVVNDLYFDINSTPIVDCPKCASEMKRLIGPAIIELRGQRWAKDGYSTPKSVAAETK